MITQQINFPDEQAVCVFPAQPAELAQAISMLELKDSSPVIVLIGGEILPPQAAVTLEALEALAEVAENLQALMICGGTDMGVMAEIGRVRQRKGQTFPLLGIAPEALVTWPGGPHGFHFLGLGQKRWDLAAHYTHFILVPGREFGAESPWIVEAAALLSKGERSVTVLINGGTISRQDIALSIEKGRPVIALGGTGRLANELASAPRQALITVVPANAGDRVREALRAALSNAAIRPSQA